MWEVQNRRWVWKLKLTIRRIRSQQACWERLEIYAPLNARLFSLILVRCGLRSWNIKSWNITLSYQNCGNFWISDRNVPESIKTKLAPSGAWIPEKDNKLGRRKSMHLLHCFICYYFRDSPSVSHILHSLTHVKYKTILRTLVIPVISGITDGEEMNRTNTTTN